MTSYCEDLYCYRLSCRKCQSLAPECLKWHGAGVAKLQLGHRSTLSLLVHMGVCLCRAGNVAVVPAAVAVAAGSSAV